MSEKHGRHYSITATRGSETQSFNVRGGGKGIKLVEQLESDGWTVTIKQVRAAKRQTTRRRDYGDED